MTIPWQQLAIAETPAVRLRVLKHLVESSEPQSATSISRALRVDLRSVSYHLLQLDLRGFLQLDHVGDAPGRQHFFRMVEAS